MPQLVKVGHWYNRTTFGGRDPVQNRKLDHFRPDAATVISGMVARTSHATLGKWRSGRSLTYLSPQDTNFVYIRPWVTEFERQNKQVTINNNESLL